MECRFLSNGSKVFLDFLCQFVLGCKNQKSTPGKRSQKCHQFESVPSHPAKFVGCAIIWTKAASAGRNSSAPRKKPTLTRSRWAARSRLERMSPIVQSPRSKTLVRVG